MRQALLLKRTGRIVEALPLFKEVGTTEALIELAKYAEHQQKDVVSAIRYTEQAITLVEQQKTILKQTVDKQQQALNHRLARLERKRL
jgi:NADH dehydrogenase FAD-containing subunit